MRSNENCKKHRKLHLQALRVYKFKQKKCNCNAAFKQADDASPMHAKHMHGLIHTSGFFSSNNKPNLLGLLC